MPTYILPEADALALNAALSGPVEFAAQNSQGLWLHNPDDLSPAGVDQDALVNGEGLGSTVALYLASLSVLEDTRCKIFRYVEDPYLWDTENPPRDLNYISGLTVRLYPETIKTQGEVTDVHYWVSAVVESDGSITYSDKVIHEHYVYVRDVAGFALSRVLTISWIQEDDNPHPVTKDRPKVYGPSERIREGKRRRGNVIDDVEIQVAGMLLNTELENQGNDVQATLDLGRALIAEYKTEIDLFVEGSIQDLYTRLGAETGHTWLDNVVSAPNTTIRDTLLSEINIWGLV